MRIAAGSTSGDSSCRIAATLALAGCLALAGGCATSPATGPAPAPIAISEPPSIVRLSSASPASGVWLTSVVRASIVTAALPSSSPPAGPGSLTGHKLEGIASFYWQDQMTANGEQFDKSAMTAAHKTLPFNTRVRVTHLATGRAVIVRINDRGPYKPGRIIDLSDAAAGALGMKGQGLAPVRVDVLR